MFIPMQRETMFERTTCIRDVVTFTMLSTHYASVGSCYFEYIKRQSITISHSTFKRARNSVSEKLAYK